MRDILSKLYFYYNYRRRNIYLKSLPQKIWIEPTNICNIKCKICPQSSSKFPNRGFMDIELLRKIAAEIQHIRPSLVTLHLSGEPLLHRQIDEFVRIIKDHGLSATFSTNGLLLTKDRAKSLIDAGLDAIRIDFAADKEVYESIRQKSLWKTVYANIHDLLEAKKEKGVVKPVVSLVNIDVTDDQEETENKRQDLMNLFQGYQFESSNLELHSWAGDFAQKTTHDSSINGLSANKHKLKTFSPCIHPFASFNITWDGFVVPCCRDLLRDYVIGDINKNTILEVWNSDKLLRLRKIHAENRYKEEPLCADCDQVWRDYSFMKMVIKTLSRIKFLLLK